MTLAASYRAWRLASSLSAYRRRDAAPGSPAEAVRMQLVDLNAAWQKSLACSPWARAIARAESLPERFESWAEFDARTPILDKGSLREALARVEQGSSKVMWRATGGSTGEPFQFPVWPREAMASGLDIWLGRSRLSICPSDPVFLLWGHAHLLGTGVRGAINKIKRTLSDRMLGYTRVSAYALASSDLAEGCDLLLSRKPAYVIGYSSALDRFARYNANRATEIAKLRLKAVIATAESFPRSDSAEVIAHTFGAPVAMEYGTVETGPLAYQDAEGCYSVFHAHYRLSLRGGDGPSANEILVTSLYPRALPLLRYALGDLAEYDHSDIEQGSVLRLKRVVGRCNDIVTLPTGAIVHSEVFTHCVRDIPTVDAFQIVAAKGEWPRIRYKALADLSGDAVSQIRRRLALIDPGMGATELERVNSFTLSIAGKHRMVVEN
jgi:phenylacetate-CoA ligase